MCEAPRQGGVTWASVKGSSITLGRVVQTGDPAEENTELVTPFEDKFVKSFNQTKKWMGNGHTSVAINYILMFTRARKFSCKFR